MARNESIRNSEVTLELVEENVGTLGGPWRLNTDWRLSPEAEVRKIKLTGLKRDLPDLNVRGHNFSGSFQQDGPEVLDAFNRATAAIDAGTPPNQFQVIITRTWRSATKTPTVDVLQDMVWMLEEESGSGDDYVPARISGFAAEKDRQQG